MHHFPVGLSAAGLCVCIVLSAFFSGTETALMSVNRYRLRHLAGQGHAAARLAERLLARPYRLLLWLTYPVVWLINLFTNALLRLIGVPAAKVASHSLSADELRTVVAEAGSLIPIKHQQML